MKRLMVWVPVLALMAYGNVMAAEKTIAVPQDATISKEKQMEKLGALRGRLILKMEELRKTLDNNQNGANLTAGTVQGIQAKVTQAINKQIQEENAKAQEMRNQALVDNLNKKNQMNSERWNEFNQKDWATCGKTINEQNQVYVSLTPIFGNVSNLELAWSNSGIDLEMLIGVLAAIEKRTDEVKAKVTAALSDLNATVAVWEAFAKE